MRGTLIVTNDYPPRPGGIQSFVHGLACLLPPDQVAVYAPAWDGAEAFDRALPFPVVRHPTSLMLPVPSVARRATAALREYEFDTVIYGASAPLGLLAPTLRKAGASRQIALTHGHEAGWAALPGARQLLRRIGDTTDVVTYLGEYFRVRLAKVMSPAAAARMVRLAPGVDVATFRDAKPIELPPPPAGGPDGPVVLCVSRLVPRKGQDTLIRAWPAVRAAHPDARLLLVSDGPYRGELVRLADEVGVTAAVTFTGSVPAADLPGYYAASDVFAMPCRTRRAGLDVEGLGIVYLEASAAGLPVIGGDSGGAPDAILDGETGYVVPGRSVPVLAERIIGLLSDPARARAMGQRGLDWVEQEWDWSRVASRLHALLEH
ncbi:MAG: glycosyltransferase family 4 protein [Actinobacteria bacterium]|nr:glycosyltransferase family 4 protein [Actinomycetota bacterium]